MTRLSKFSLAVTATLLAGMASLPLAAQSPASQGTLMPGDRYPFVKADVDFLQGMIAHHSQAVVMAHWAPTHGASASVQGFAARIARAQTAEIGTMSQWLHDHHQAVPTPDTTAAGQEMDRSMAMPGMKMDTLMPGMLTPEQMKQLDAARGPEFDRLFLTFMIQHHQGALSMVETLFGSQGAAQDDVIFKFASDVSADQTAEIDRMGHMLDAMGAGSQ